jgi:diacylglycerol kinase family enzyme
VTASATPPSTEQRAAAIASIALAVAFLVLTVALFTVDVRRSVIAAPLVLIAIAAAWLAITRAGVRKRVAVIVCVVALVGALLTGFIGGFGAATFSTLRVVCLIGAGFLGRRALGRDTRSLRDAPVPGRPVPPARHGVLIVNPRSGDGKAERVGLEEAASKRGIEVVSLVEGSDLHALTTDALDRGADVIGMAGGDGSQALVASIAAERDVPMVVVPAGTRNHFAMDIGLDRDDVVGALDAYGDAIERPIDLGDVNDEVFVNNVSLGIYATIVRSPEYREAKVDTTLSTLQEALAPDTPPFDLRYTDDQGTYHAGAHLIQVSNGAYGETLEGLTSRTSLEEQELQVITLEIDDDRSMASLLAAFAARHPERHAGYRSWTARTFEVASGGPVDVGLDGEARAMDPPLRFTIRDRPVRIRLPNTAIGYSPASRALHWRSALTGVLHVAAGHAVSIEPSGG